MKADQIKAPSAMEEVEGVILGDWEFWSNENSKACDKTDYDALSKKSREIARRLDEALELRKITDRTYELVLQRAEAAERKLEEARFSPMGDNHHNAVLCPFCRPGLDSRTRRAIGIALGEAAKACQVEHRKYSQQGNLSTACRGAINYVEAAIRALDPEAIMRKIDSE